MSATELIEAIKAKGGVLILNGGRINFQLPKDAVCMLNLLQEHKSEVTEILRTHGGRMATFPHCPRCASHALYRRNNTGAYECQTCGLHDIDEVTARRIH